MERVEHYPGLHFHVEISRDLYVGPTMCNESITSKCDNNTCTKEYLKCDATD